MSVTTIHPEYIAATPLWDTTTDAASGNAKIKAGKAKYLPVFIPDDTERYAQYLQRAFFMGVTGRTQNSLVGMVFRKPPTYDVPTTMADVLENADGAGQSLEQLSKDAVAQLLVTARHSFLVDYPSVDPTIDRETERQLGARPTISPYTAESLINWKSEVINGTQKLTLAVLMELRSTSTDEFEHSYATQYRVLRLKNGVYTQEVLDAKGNTLVAEFAPTMAGGATFDHIPFHIAGAQNNLPDVDLPPPLYDLAIVNIAHYQTTADHRENLFMHGQLTLGITSDMDAVAFKAANPNGILVGARTGYFLGASGAFHTVTAPESSSLRAALTDLESQMVMLGARLVQSGGQAETAEATRINASAEASTLDILVNNLSEALEASLEDVARFLGIDPNAIEYRLNREFWEGSIDAATLGAIIAAGDAGVIARSDQLNMIRRGRIEIAEGRTDETIQQEVADSLLDI